MEPSSAGAATEPRALPLAGIKVLDLSRVLAGPWATMSLADLGAEVWKVENVDGGDDTRAWRVPNYKGMGAYFLCANRGKKSISLDLKKPEAVAIVRELASQADIVVENFRAGTVDRLGIGQAALRALNPRLIYCSISGYGQSGPEAKRPGYDFIMQAEGGIMAITGHADSQPLRVGVAITDLACGMIAVQSILAALYERERTGQGQYLDLALFDSALNLLANIGSGYLNTGVVPPRSGNAHGSIVPYQVFETRDRPLALAVGNDRQFRTLCTQVVGLPELADDPSFATSAARAHNRDELVERLAQVFSTDSSTRWTEACAKAGIPAGIVKSIPEVFESPSVVDRNAVHELTHPHLGTVSLVRPAHGIEAQRDSEFAAPPLLGEHTKHILRDVLGYDDARMEQLLDTGVIGDVVLPDAPATAGAPAT